MSGFISCNEVNMGLTRGQLKSRISVTSAYACTKPRLSAKKDAMSPARAPVYSEKKLREFSRTEDEVRLIIKNKPPTNGSIETSENTRIRRFFIFMVGPFAKVEIC